MTLNHLNLLVYQLRCRFLQQGQLPNIMLDLMTSFAVVCGVLAPVISLGTMKMSPPLLVPTFPTGF